MKCAGQLWWERDIEGWEMDDQCFDCVHWWTNGKSVSPTPVFARGKRCPMFEIKEDADEPR